MVITAKALLDTNSPSTILKAIRDELQDRYDASRQGTTLLLADYLTPAIDFADRNGF